MDTPSTTHCTEGGLAVPYFIVGNVQTAVVTSYATAPGYGARTCMLARQCHAQSCVKIRAGSIGQPGALHRSYRALCASDIGAPRPNTRGKQMSDTCTLLQGRVSSSATHCPPLTTAPNLTSSALAWQILCRSDGAKPHAVQAKMTAVCHSDGITLPHVGWANVVQRSE